MRARLLSSIGWIMSLSSNMTAYFEGIVSCGLLLLHIISLLAKSLEQVIYVQNNLLYGYRPNNTFNKTKYIYSLFSNLGRNPI